MQWAIVLASFLASAVEFVEAFTLVLVAGITVNWRSAMVGALVAVATLAVIIATLGVALVTLIPLDVLRFVIGFLLVLFGLKWLKNAIQRYSGLKFLHSSVLPALRGKIKASDAMLSISFPVPRDPTVQVGLRLRRCSENTH